MTNKKVISKLGDIGKVSMCKRVLKHQTTQIGEIPFYKISTFGKQADSFITKDLYDEFRGKYSYPKKGDILISAAGTVGKTVIFDGEPAYFQDSNIVWIGNNETKILNRYLYYFYQTRPWLTTSGNIIERIYNDNLRSIEVTYPESLQKQQQITAVLSALDAKIDCNKRINAELEAMAKTLYDYWFVQFEFPDANGKPYKSSGGKMVYNATLNREIPEGWAAGTAADLFNFNPSLSLPKSAEASYIDMSSLPVTGFMTATPEIKEFAGGMKFQNGDVAIARITPCLENGKTALISLLKGNEVGFGSTEFIILRGKHFPLSAFACQLSRSVPFRQFAISNMTGTSGRKRIDANTLETYSLPLPSQEVLMRYEEITESFFKRMTNNANESHQLTQLRDWLLPMLMNGQVTVA